jgi:hypothetical protein
MPLFHCTKCMHEWESSSTNSKCDWCNTKGYILAEKTDFESFLESDFFKKEHSKSLGRG